MEYIEEYISFAETTMNDLFNAQSRRGSEPAYNEYYPLHAAVERGEFSKVEKELQKKDMIIDEKDWFCCTPLTYAVIKCLHYAVLSKKGRFVEYNNSLKIVKALRDSGAMPEKMTLPMSVDEDHLYTWDGADCEDEGRLGHQGDIYELVKDVHAKLEDIDDSQVKEKILELYTYLHARRTVPAANVMVAKAAKPRVGPGPAPLKVKKEDPWEKSKREAREKSRYDGDSPRWWDDTSSDEEDDAGQIKKYKKKKSKKERKSRKSRKVKPKSRLKRKKSKKKSKKNTRKRH